MRLTRPPTDSLDWKSVLKHFKKLVVRRFEERLASALPQFAKFRADAPVGDLLYRHQALPHLQLLLALTVDSERDAVSLSVGWLRPGANLWDCDLEGPEPHDAPGQLFSLAFFWQQDDGRWLLIEEGQADRLRWLDEANEVCWRVQDATRWVTEHPQLYPEQLGPAEQQVDSLVDHLFERLLQHGVPYFDKRVAEETGSDSCIEPLFRGDR